MHISSLSLRNFRNFRSAKLQFEKGINTIIGENGSGKTNLFYALRLLLDESMPRYIYFSPTDFSRSLKNWVGHWIIIAIDFDELDVSDEAQALAMQATGHMDTESKGSYAIYFRPKYEVRKQLFEYSKLADKSQEGLALLLNNFGIQDYETLFLSRGIGGFSDEAIYKQYVGDFDNIVFPDPDVKEETIFGTYLPRRISIHDEVSCTYIKALRDVEADLKSYSNNPLVNLLRGKGKTVDIATEREIVENIDKLNAKIGSLEEVKRLKEGIDKNVKEAVGTTYAPNIDIKSELPNEIEKLVQSLKLWVGDPDDEGYKGRIWELSLGGANLIFLSLKLLEYEKIRTDRVANLLLIEEPEAHVHTHIQKTLFNNLKANKAQILISTHSTHISSVSKISSVNVLSRGVKESLVFQPSNGLTKDQILRLERYLDAVRSNLLFAKGIILVEGDAEQILIPEMFRAVFGLTLDEIGVSLINIGSTGFENIGIIFNDKRIRKNCSILTDTDLSVVPLNADPAKDSDYEKHCRASEKSGNERKALLTTFCSGNKFIKPFYAKYTFEVDFLINDNDIEVIDCLDEIYKKPETIHESTQKLKNPAVEISGVEVLKLAKTQGKGWFALLLSEQLTWETNIPNYILEAIAFSAAHVDTSSLLKAAAYRIQEFRADIHDPNYAKAEAFKMEGKSAKEIMEQFKVDFPTDQLTSFLKLL